MQKIVKIKIENRGNWLVSERLADAIINLLNILGIKETKETNQLKLIQKIKNLFKKNNNIEDENLGIGA